MIKKITTLLLALILSLPMLALAADEYTEELYELYCHACHGIKGSGAPMAFNPKEWKPYLKKGISKSLNNAITGIGNMPAMGTCSECGISEMRELIEYMSRKE